MGMMQLQTKQKQKTKQTISGKRQEGLQVGGFHPELKPREETDAGSWS